MLEQDTAIIKRQLAGWLLLGNMLYIGSMSIKHFNYEHFDMFMVELVYYIKNIQIRVIITIYFLWHIAIRLGIF